MTMAVLLSLIIRRNISPRERMIVAMSYNLNDYGSTVKLVRRILLGTVGFELLGAALLAIRFIPKFGTGRGIYMSVFHSISAFCNAGFDILGNGNSMGDYYGDPLVCLTLMALISIGGIGFIVWGDLVNFRTRRKLSVYSKFVLILTAVLTVLGTAYVAISEWNNPLTIGNYSVGEKLLCSAFQSVTWRTAGFATVDQASLHGATKIFGGIMMFIGGASGSTAGGVKVATVGILVLTVMSVSVGKPEINLFKRRVPSGVILRAMTLVSIQLILIFVAALLCNAVSSASLIDLFYEVVSAGGTVGLTASLTPTLHPFALVVLMCMMFFGRLGILTITLAIATRSSERSPSILTYPDANILIG
jgi:trk system potassium uptake protein TrkH